MRLSIDLEPEVQYTINILTAQERCKMFNRLLGRLAVKYPKIFGRFVRFNLKDI